MTLLVFCIVLVAAVVHASWNALLKGGGDPLIGVAIIAAISAVLALGALPFFPAPDPASYPYLAASTLVQVGYFVVLARTYRVGDMSITYPIMRGLPPLLVAVFATAVLGERIEPAGWAGVALVSAGIFSLLLAGVRRGRALGAAGTGYALLNALIIASYTVLDGLGVRAANSLGYISWVFIITGGTMGAWALLRRRADVLTMLQARGPRMLAAGVGNYVAYALVLWAMTQAPIPLVAALRESSIVFGAVIAALVLREHVTRWRIVAAILIALGAAMLRLG